MSAEGLIGTAIGAATAVYVIDRVMPKRKVKVVVIKKSVKRRKTVANKKKTVRKTTKKTTGKNTRKTAKRGGTRTPLDNVQTLL